MKPEYKYTFREKFRDKPVTFNCLFSFFSDVVEQYLLYSSTKR